MTASQPGVAGRSEAGSKFFGDSEANTPSGSEIENMGPVSNADRRRDLFGRFLKGNTVVTAKSAGKPVKKRRAVDEPTVEEHMRPVPADLEELETAPTAQAMASALEWIEDIEVVRKNSSYQGVLSRRIKERAAALGKLMKVFASRVEEKVILIT